MTDYSGYGIPEGWQGAIVAPSSQLTSPGGKNLTQRLFNEILEKHGTWMVYVRSLRDFPCTRCRPNQVKPGEGDGDCPVCLGLGYKAKIERAQVFLSKGRRTMTQEADIVPGKFGDSSFRAFFRTALEAKSGDYILEVTWNVARDKVRYAGEPTRIIHVYSLDAVESLYFGGEPVYSVTELDSYDHHIDPITKALAERRT